MVSFQCHGCGDVVKKPKLDQHRSRCSSGFDCIDCSKTFKSPAEYKGHTSCISEAEKYQKGLYKGPKTGANGAKSSDSPQPNSLSDKKDTTHTPVPRQSNAQWNRNTQATSLDNINGYPAPQHQHSQNGWQNGRGYSDRGRKGSNRQHNRFTGSSASGANDTPLGISRRSSDDDAVVVNGRGAPTFNSGNDGASQTKAQAGVSEANGKPLKEKWQPKVVATEICSSQTGKEIPTELDTERNPVAVCNDVKEDGKRKRKRKNEANGDAGLETVTAKAGTAGSDIKEIVKKEKGGREKDADEKPALADADAVHSGDKKKTKKVKKQQEAADEPVDEVDAGKEKRKKEKKRKEKNADNVGEAEPLVAKDVEISATVNEPTTKPKKRKKKGTADSVTENPETPVVENAAAEVAVVTATVPDQTTKKKKRDITETISETATNVDREEKQKKKETRRREDDVEIDTKVGRKESKRKRQEEPNDSNKEKRRKHTS